jgi:hypothetical protein
MMWSAARARRFSFAKDGFGDDQDFALDRKAVTSYRTPNNVWSAALTRRFSFDKDGLGDN